MPAQASPAPSAGAPVQIEMKNVHLHVAAGVVLGLWFVMQLLSGGMSIGGPGGGVAFFAHIGGFVAGMALIGFFKRPDVPFFSPPRSGRWDL